MRPIPAALAILVLCLASPAPMFAQSSQTSPATTVPRLVNFSGVYRPADGQPLTPVEQVTLAVYAQETGGTPLWQETQRVAVDAEGRYTVLLGATQPDGVPLDVFASGQAQWLGIKFDRPGDVEGARARITSVPYALHAADAVTLGGRPASDYVLTPTKNGLATTSAASTTTASADPTVNALNVVLTGTPNALAKYVNADDVGPSAVSEASGRLGINTGAALPLDYLHIRFSDPFGAFTGLAVQNLSNNANAASGMLFYDHNGALTQFQGFNNTNHGYVINNIAKNGANQFDGSYSFLIGSIPRFNVASSGNIGIGTTTPSALLEVSNAVPGGPANMWMTSYTNAVNPYYMARRARGTPGAPAAVQNGDGLAGFYGEGYGTTGFGGFAGGITVQAVQNFTDTAHGTALAFATTAFNTTAMATRMTLDAGGNLGIGTSLPTALLEISNGLTPGGPASATIATYNAAPGGSFLLGRKARGTSAAPTAVQNGDGLLSLSGRGYGTTQFGVGGGATIGMSATENFTDTAMGARIQFFTTPNGTTTPTSRMTIDQNGNVGIGTASPSATLEALRQGGSSNILTTSFEGGGSAFLARNAHGTPGAPSALQLGDDLGAFGVTGYGATHFGEFNAGMQGFAAENWTDTAQGAILGLASTPIGTTDTQIYVAVMPDGNVGIGAFNAIPTILDKLQVFGDIRVGTSGTNGCLNNFAGTGIAGTCASDRRFKKDITPFGPALASVTALQPVHYFWRAAEFPDRHFSDAQRAYGLIAQDVEQVLPELVVTNEDGYKAVDYSKLPLLTIQAVKELKAENDALKLRVGELDRQLTETDRLKARVAELERLMTELLVTAGRR